MNITDFAKGRGLDPQRVSRYINRHSVDFEALITREGKNVILSDEALDRLDQVYPLPKPVEVIIDHESRDKLILAQEQIIHLQQQLAEQAPILADAKYHQLLLEQRNEELERERETVTQQQEEIADLGDQISEKDDEIRRLREQLEEVHGALAAEQAQREQMEQASILGRIFKTWK